MEKKQPFESYLEERMITDFPELCPTKDRMEDAFERFLENLEIDEWIKYATQWEQVINF